MALQFRRVSFVFVLVFFVTVISLHSCITFRMSPKEIDQFFASKNVKGIQHTYKTGFRDMHFVAAGDSTKPLVLFIHGSPGSLSAFIDFLTDSALLSSAFLITADRPGFGYSNFGLAEPSLQKQSEDLLPILQRYKKSRPTILVGHSLGGPLIAQMAIDYPHLIDGLIIVAGSVDPELEPNETWFRAPLASPFLSWILPPSFRASNDEIYQLKPELQKLKPLWGNIRCPVTIIHGTKDSFVPIKNTEFVKKILVNTKTEFIIVEGMDHFVPWSNPELIEHAVLKLLDEINKQCAVHSSPSAIHDQ
jgi:pimeloyl-ACP methyl ester carboxylesterase